MGCFQGRGIAALLMIVVSLCAFRSVLATTYKVGDDAGWRITSYDSWLSGKTFKEGDTLEFVYTSAHDVVEVNEANYGSCSAGSNKVNTDGDTSYILTGTGTKYYICSVPTHCDNGMKLAVVVEAASTPSPTTPTTPSTTPTTPSTTPSTSPTTPSPSNTTTPSSSNNSSPLSLPPSSSILFLLVGLFILFLNSS